MTSSFPPLPAAAHLGSGTATPAVLTLLMPIALPAAERSIVRR